ncbi:MAG: AraC family transcriptional regulator [Propionivibrio sp.]
MESAPSDSTGRCIYDVLGASRARLERACALGDGLRLAQWYNHDDSPRYAEPGHHTVSVYLAGGFGTYPTIRPDLRGSPGRICILPAEHESQWIVEGELRFLHLYVSDLAWAERVVRLIDAEPRAVTLEERILEEDAGLAHWARLLANEHWTSAEARLLMNSASHAMLDHLVLAAARPAQRGAALRPRGGLSAVARRRVVDWIEAHLADSFTLADLAAQAALSEFHFARMFRVSMGVTPHAWVAQHRFARACALLSGKRQDGPALERVAAACGYANASHLNRRFREELGVTPTRYRGK